MMQTTNSYSLGFLITFLLLPQSGWSLCERQANVKCENVYIPFCGASGRQYDSMCEAFAFCDLNGAKGCIKTASLDTLLTSERDITHCPERNQICDYNFSPVCGKNGRTYPNECFAQADCVHIRYSGSCLSAEISVKRLLSATPVCPKANETCDDTYSPVCGQDGVTYPNQCIALANCTTISYNGFCTNMTTTSGPPPGCPSQGQMCYEVYLPVCGEDGITYPNECFAQANCMNVSFPGPCSNMSTMPLSATFSNPSPKACPTQGQVCSVESSPVCGKDGLTYASECIAHANCVLVIHKGPCPVGPPPAPNSISKGCSTKGQFCSDLYAPVCGKDGMTYTNECFAKAECVHVSHIGPCNSTSIPPSPSQMPRPPSPLSCPTQGQVCPFYVDPVCGKDGVTYTNACIAHSNCAHIKHKGACISSPPPTPPLSSSPSP